MAIAPTDLVSYASADKPIDDVSAAGGAVDPLERVVFTDLAANDDVEVVSDDAGDTTQNITVYARHIDGTDVSETVQLDGLTPVVLSVMGQVERIQRALLDDDCDGTVTVQRSPAGAVIGEIPTGERGFRRMFINAFSDPVAPKDYYEKFFWQNNHATLALLGAVIKEAADPTGKITFAIEDAQNDNEATADRLTAPVGIVAAFDSADKTIPGDDLGPTDCIGVWAELSLDAANAPIKSTWTSEIDGKST